MAHANSAVLIHDDQMPFLLQNVENVVVREAAARNVLTVDAVQAVHGAEAARLSLVVVRGATCFWDCPVGVLIFGGLEDDVPPADVAEPRHIEMRCEPRSPAK